MIQSTPINLADYRNIVILTGAGVSVASGIPPFRGPGGLWNAIAPEQLTTETAQHNPDLIWQLLGPMRTKIHTAAPNPAHHHLARVETSLKAAHPQPGQSFTLITQNIDGLHQKAGSQNVLELHGSLHRTRCLNKDCSAPSFLDRSVYENTAGNPVPRCSKCDAYLLPDVVLFNEPLPAYAEWQSKRRLRNCDLFIAIGTSGHVSPASNFVRSADYAGARTILINLETDTPSPYFHETITGRAEEILPELLVVKSVSSQ